ncbi:uncharacterized protein BP5553_03851 [Venustampulla echinocandica]|uniref:EF-hand domain-containing protein n=1 Tax=Venustampulla echinocandica TaxID=2656787 RepID=A0A370TVF9_9HELO|nr:uncharacterized protein BP5553_03851 [Venustampulla echinocandica]RDL39511.1 hypothetical protein BP5553_03851 [Venustampulla echinocandica]
MSTTRRSTQGKDPAASTTQSAAALQGASLAFRKIPPPVKPKPLVNIYSGNNGALAAATKAGEARNDSSTDKLDIPGHAQRAGHLGYNGSPNNKPSGIYSSSGRDELLRSETSQSRSPSFIAATLAASRSPSRSPNTASQQQQSPSSFRRDQRFSTRSPSPVKSMSSSTDSLNHAPLDVTPIAPTTSLISMFESTGAKSKSPSSVSKPASSVSQKSEPPPSPSQISLSPTRGRIPLLSPPKPQQPEFKARKCPVTQPASPRPKAQLELGKATAPTTLAKPIPIPRRSRSQSELQNEEDDASSDDSFVSASDYRPSMAQIYGRGGRLASPSSASINSSVTVDSLANAIVASSLASSRAASPSTSSGNRLVPPPPPPARRSPRHRFHHHGSSRTPSPLKHTGLRTTMRKPKSKEDINEREKKLKRKHLMKKHPNKHHEGDRKRWRDQITERERKRCEAVWASNRGLYLSSPGSENCVCNLVVRDIWSRSRLHQDVLEEVYALVDRHGNGMLTKEEFVVGIWMIDQRLKGRKLPIRVSGSVWRSVGVLGDVQVKKGGKGK